jgi:hypothetical protein
MRVALNKHPGVAGIANLDSSDYRAHRNYSQPSASLLATIRLNFAVACETREGLSDAQRPDPSLPSLACHHLVVMSLPIQLLSGEELGQLRVGLPDPNNEACYAFIAASTKSFGSKQSIEPFSIRR